MELFRALASYLIDMDRRPRPLELQLQERVRVEQLDFALRLAPFTVITSVSVIQVVTYLFWHPDIALYLATLQLLALPAAAIALERCWRWRSTAKPQRVESGYVEWFVRLAFVSGVLVGSIPLMLFARADADGRLLIASTCAGLIATGIGLAVVPRAAISFSGPIVVGSFIALASTGEAFYIFVAILLAIYSGFIYETIVHLARLVTMRATSQVELERQQELTNLLLNDFEENASDWLWETDRDLRLRHVSTRFGEVADARVEDLQDQPLGKLLPPPARTGQAPAAAMLWSSLGARLPFRNIVLPVEVSGTERWWALSGKPIIDTAGRFSGYRGVGSDVTQKKLTDDRLSYLASHDALTELPNRSLFQKKLSDVCSGDPQANRFAVLRLDLDAFKSVNDTFGHGVGDALLKNVALRLSNLTGPALTVARLAGDEFAIVADGHNRDMAAELAGQLVDRISAPYRIGDLRISVGVSIGIATAPENGSEEVMRRADVALYRMKEEGGRGFRFYEAVMDEQIEECRTLTGELRGALERREFVLHFQPQVSARGATIEGFEVLLRWQHPTRGLVPPDEFISLAEQSGAIIPMGQWVISEACRIAASWPSNLTVAVNLSPIQFRHSDVVAIVRDALQESGLAAERLELEITESVFLEATQEILDILRTLRNMGVSLSLDDFGTGYSSLSYLRRAPFTKIKIDRSFVRDLPDARTDVAIIRAVVQLGTSLGMTVTAEGVESIGQQNCLAEQGCHQFQGYLYSRPVPAEEAEALISKPRLNLVNPHAA
ncbi:EAL domain-containing protein [Aurantimonas sp. A2-1-M11]|uniref:putative bifunctional diguanylate cyclase/phosphodiesterase n=1 Tax=Aurantimonas sp. A2-1-M11 TaxID=3113712 RepID=UPI002F922B39